VLSYFLGGRGGVDGVSRVNEGHVFVFRVMFRPNERASDGGHHRRGKVKT
jgi:hypothetical protein